MRSQFHGIVSKIVSVGRLLGTSAAPGSIDDDDNDDDDDDAMISFSFNLDFYARCLQ